MPSEVIVTDWIPIQRRLRELGFYSGVIDGQRGPLTDDAIVAFKRSIGFTPRPLFGELTREALMRRPPALSVFPWFVEAQRMLGLHERRDTSALKAWFDAAVAQIDPRQISWCGAFVATCMRKWQPGVLLPVNPLGARQWGSWGEDCTPQRGAVLTFWRGSPNGWQGHVAFYHAEDDTAFHVLGGNQADAVTITRIAKTRLLRARWPSGQAQPLDIRAVAAGGSLSTNEA